jgi:hypothetical protein
MARAPIGDAQAPGRLDAVVRSWRARWLGSGLAAEVEHHDGPDPRGHFHWLIRLRGEERSVITIWLDLRQRTVRVETELMPAPEANLEELYRYLLVKNADLADLHLAIGPEAGIYLVGAVPLEELDESRLDEVVGQCVHVVDTLFPTVMAMGLPGYLRRRRREG